MYFVVMAYDAPGKGETRVAQFEAHVAHLNAAPTGVSISIGGPLLDAAGVSNGSMFVVEAPDLASATAFVEQDPFQVHGVWQSMSVNGFDWRRGKPI